MKMMKKLPFWLIALLFDAVFFWILHLMGSTLCKGSQSCYFIKADGDRLTDYFALIVAIMAILIPLSIELWRDLFQSHNLGKKSELDNEWDKSRRSRYLYEPLGSIATLTILCVVLPLIIKSSALFYAAVLYGLYVLFYIFFVAFFRKSIDIYETDGLNPSPPNLPNPDIMLELLNATQNKPETPKSNPVSPPEGPDWALQLSEDRTLNKFGDWANQALKKEATDVTSKMYVWMLLNSFLQKCDPMLIWRSINDGVIKALVQVPSFYDDSSVRSGQVIKTIVGRLADDDSGYDILRDFFYLAPIPKIKNQGTLNDAFVGGFRELFFKSSDKTYLLNDAFPPEWQVSKANLEGSNKMVRVTSIIYLNWMRDLQKYAQEINERAAIATTEFLFPEVEIMLFAKFVLLGINGWILQTPTPESLQQEIDRWQLFGRMSRVRTEWTPVDGSDEEIDKRFTQYMQRSSESTLELIRQLGWYPKDKAALDTLSKNLIRAINKFDWEREEYKKSWQNFAKLLPKLAVEETK